VGGNLCNAAPSADIAPPLLAFDAEAVIVGPNGRRSLPLAEFFAGPGRTVLAADELLAEVRVAETAGGIGSAYMRHTPRKQMDIAAVGVAALLTIGAGDGIEDARIALGAVAPTPSCCREGPTVTASSPERLAPARPLACRCSPRALAV
jgi:carbon-monoxide dehydrogenase medium subunit